MRRERFLEFKGLLFIPERDFNTVPYVFIDDEDNTHFDLTSFLIKYQGKNIGLVITNKYGKDIFNEIGKVQIIYGAIKVNGRDIGDVLWDKSINDTLYEKMIKKEHNNVKGKMMSILIDTVPEKEDLEENS